jgi:hypothetical protein
MAPFILLYIVRPVVHAVLLKYPFDGTKATLLQLAEIVLLMINVPSFTFVVSFTNRKV